MSSPPIYTLTAGRAARLAEFLGPLWFVQNLGPGIVFLAENDRQGAQSGVALLPFGHLAGGPIDALWATTDTTGTTIALVQGPLAMQLFNPRIASGGGGVVQQGARDASAQEWDVRFLTAQPVSLNAEGIEGGLLPSTAVLIAAQDVATGFLRYIRSTNVEPPGAIDRGLVVRVAGRGQQLMAASIPVVISSDQSAIPTTGGGGASPYSQTLPTGWEGVYSFSLRDAAGVAAANRFLSVFNPAASGKQMLLLLAKVESYSVAIAATKNSLRLARITAASVGTLQAASAINKFKTSYVATSFEFRTANPTVTVAAEIDAFGPNENITAVSSNAISRRVLEPKEFGWGEFLFAPGEGFVFDQTIAGDVDQTYDIMAIVAQRT